MTQYKIFRRKKKMEVFNVFQNLRILAHWIQVFKEIFKATILKDKCRFQICTKWHLQAWYQIFDNVSISKQFITTVERYEYNQLRVRLGLLRKRCKNSFGYLKTFIYVTLNSLILYTYFLGFNRSKIYDYFIMNYPHLACY